MYPTRYAEGLVEVGVTNFVTYKLLVSIFAGMLIDLVARGAFRVASVADKS